jgi:putative membrane protein
MQWWCAALGEQWTWSWRAYPGVWLFIILVVAGLRAIAGDGLWTRASTGARAALVCGVASLWIALDWPLGPIAAGYLASAHALQFLIETMVAAPLVLVAVRDAFGTRAAIADVTGVPGGSPALRRFARFLVHPLVAALLFNVIVAATHVPAVVDAFMPQPAGAFIVDAAWFIGGVIFWWPVVMPAPEWPHFGVPLKILYLLVGTLFHTVIGMVMLSAEFPIYGIYELAPPILPVAPRADQQLAGGIMELGVFGAIVIGSAILFFRWAGRDERGTATS